MAPKRTIPCALHVLRWWNIFSASVFVLLGIALIVVGANARESWWSGESQIFSADSAIYIGCLVLGSLILIVSLLGLIGSIRLSKVMLSVFFGIMLMLFLAQVGFGVYVAKKK
jgi:hypothetical protein